LVGTHPSAPSQIGPRIAVIEQFDQFGCQVRNVASSEVPNRFATDVHK
jgi:hypothetical protein